FYVGHIRRCEILPEDIARAARAELKRRGWFRDMAAQVRRIGGNEDGLKYDRATPPFNVRFRMGDATLYDPMVPVGARDGVRRLRRYTLVHLGDDLPTVENEWTRRVGTTERRGIGKRRRSAVSPGEVDLVHGQLQNELYDVLVRRYGKEAVIMEEDFTDLKV